MGLDVGVGHVEDVAGEGASKSSMRGELIKSFPANALTVLYSPPYFVSPSIMMYSRVSAGRMG